MFLERLVIIQGRLNGDRFSDEIGITNLKAGHEVVIIVVGVQQFDIGTKVQTVLHNIVTTSRSNHQAVGDVVVAIKVYTTLCHKHPVVFNGVAHTGVKTKVGFF